MSDLYSEYKIDEPDALQQLQQHTSNDTFNISDIEHILPILFPDSILKMLNASETKINNSKIDWVQFFHRMNDETVSRDDYIHRITRYRFSLTTNYQLACELVSVLVNLGIEINYQLKPRIIYTMQEYQFTPKGRKKYGDIGISARSMFQILTTSLCGNQELEQINDYIISRKFEINLPDPNVLCFNIGPLSLTMLNAFVQSWMTWINISKQHMFEFKGLASTRQEITNKVYAQINSAVKDGIISSNDADSIISEIKAIYT